MNFAQTSDKKAILGITSLIVALIPVPVYILINIVNNIGPDGKGQIPERILWLEASFWGLILLTPIVSAIIASISLYKKESPCTYAKIGLIIAAIELLPVIIMGILLTAGNLT